VKRFWSEGFRPFWADYGWFVVAAAAVFAFLLGLVGFQSQPEIEGQEISFSDSLYHSLQLFWLEYGSIAEPTSWELDLARILAGLVTFYAAVRAVTALFAEQIHAQRARFARSHVVVCGLGRGGGLVAKGFRERGDTVVAIERDPTHTAIRTCRALGAVVLVGDATDPRVLDKARLGDAAELVIFCGDDAVNAEVAIEARELVRGRSSPLRAHVQIVDYELRDLLEESHLAADASDEFVTSFFNAAERGAPTLLEAFEPFDGSGMAAARRPHLLVVGVGEMGANVIVHAALRWRVLPDVPQLPVTVVDLHAHDRIGALGRHYPRLGDVCDLNPIDMDVRSPEFDGGEFLVAAGRGPITIAYVCLDEDGRGLTAALSLRRLSELCGVPIVVRLTQLAGISKLVETERDLHTFGVLDRTCAPQVILNGTRETLARAIHDRYLHERLAEGHALGSTPAIVHWDDLAEVYRESSRRQADHIGVKLAAIGRRVGRLTDWDEPLATFTPGEIEHMAQLEHDRWCLERAGETGAVGQANPSLVPWDELTEEDRSMDRKMVEDLPVLLARVGYRIVP
jgi:hypothetical protein